MFLDADLPYTADDVDSILVDPSQWLPAAPDSGRGGPRALLHARRGDIVVTYLLDDCTDPRRPTICLTVRPDRPLLGALHADLTAQPDDGGCTIDMVATPVPRGNVLQRVVGRFTARLEVAGALLDTAVGAVHQRLGPDQQTTRRPT